MTFVVIPFLTGLDSRLDYKIVVDTFYDAVAGRWVEGPWLIFPEITFFNWATLGIYCWVNNPIVFLELDYFLVLRIYGSDKST